MRPLYTSNNNCVPVTNNPAFKPILVQLNDMYYTLNVTDYIAYDEETQHCNFLVSFDSIENASVRLGEVFFTAFTVGFN
jgi:hypothetical protein